MCKNTNSMWGGCFNEDTDPFITSINQSLPIDRRLFFYEIQSSKIHIKMLYQKSIVSKNTYQEIIDGLSKIENDSLSLHDIDNSTAEDIHTYVESKLRGKVGMSADFLHIARSRNDQVATISSLWMIDTLHILVDKINNIQRKIVEKAKKNINTIFPGLTHFQPAQPISFAFYLLSLCSMLERDKERMLDLQNRIKKECPLGSCALAGTSFITDRQYTAESLGFVQPSLNAMDSVSSRDMMIEYTSSCAICGLHLSRFMEDIIIFSSYILQWISIPDKWATGSSIMPQKKNADGAEIVRSYSGILIGQCNTFMSIMKGIPFAYCKDMQEDKKILFTCFDTLMNGLHMLYSIVDDINVNPKNMRKCLENSYTTATELADWLVRELNMSFRNAHALTGRIVQYASKNSIALSEIDIQDLQKFHSGINSEIYSALDIEQSIKNKTSYGGTAPVSVHKSINIWEKLLNKKQSVCIASLKQKIKGI